MLGVNVGQARNNSVVVGAHAVTYIGRIGRDGENMYGLILQVN